MRSTMIATAAFMAFVRLAGYITEPRLSAADLHRIVGAPNRVSARAHASSMRVVTWNVERGVNFDAIAAQLQALEADVILLQEVDRFCRRSGRRDVAHDLADRLDMNWIAAGEFQEIGEASGRVPATTGQAILSRYPIDDASVIVFGAQARLRWRFNPAQPRRGGRIALKARTAGVLVYDLHVESGGDDTLKRRQVDQVLADAARQPDRRIIVGGDFNNSAQARPELVAAFAAPKFVDALGSVLERQTQINHQHPIDWIFARGVTASAARVEKIDGVSDHYPLVATLIPSE